MLRRALVLLCIALIALFMTSCGQTYELQSITVSPTAASLYGSGDTQALVVTGNYSNGKTNVVTVKSKFQLAIPADEAGNPDYNLAAVTVNQSGIVEVIGATCTWETASSTTSSGTTYTYGTDPYLLTVSYTESGKTFTAIVPVSVNNLAGVCYDPNHPHP